MKDHAALLLALAGLAVSLVAIVMAASRDKGSPTQGQGQAALDLLDRRISTLESGMRQDVNPDRGLSGLITRTDVPNSPVRSMADVRARQQELEAQLAELGVIEHFEKQQRAVDESHALALDPQAGSKKRLEALGVLRKAGRIDDDVITSMVDLWEASLSDEEGAWTRWYLMENLDGVESPEFRDSILEWLPGEESPKLRSRAIETLGSMMPDPAVAEWLDYLGTNDPEPKLRQQALDARESSGDQ